MTFQNVPFHMLDDTTTGSDGTFISYRTDFQKWWNRTVRNNRCQCPNCRDKRTPYIETLRRGWQYRNQSGAFMKKTEYLTESG